MIVARNVSVVAQAPSRRPSINPLRRRELASGKVLLTVAELVVADGEMLAVVGPNGAGKSTLLGALSGDRALSSGAVKINDVGYANKHH